MKRTLSPVLAGAPAIPTARAPAFVAVLAAAAFGCSPAPSGPIVADVPIAVAGHVIPAADVKARLVSELGFTSIGGTVRCSYEVLDQDVTASFLWVLCEERAPGTLALGSGMSGPVVVTVDTAAVPARIASVRSPRSGGDYAADVRKMFPRRAVGAIFDAGPRAEMRRLMLEAAILAEARSAPSP